MATGSDDPEGYPIGFIWDFGDGSELAFKPVENHIYLSPDTFRVTLTVTDGKEENEFSRIITIKEKEEK